MVTKKLTMRPLLLGAVFLFSAPAYSSLKIVIADTGFCPEKAQVHSKKHKLLKVSDMTGNAEIDCRKLNAKTLYEDGRFHGQLVLNELLAFLPKKLEVTIKPLVIFDKTGTQTPEAWLKIIEYVEKEKVDLVLTASGLISDQKLVSELPGIWFIPSGRTERLITKETALFPQSLSPRPNIFMIGDYFDQKQIIYDQALLYQDQIDYYFPSGQKKFKGSSRAVAEAMAKALKKCFITRDVGSAHELRLCLLKKSKVLKDPILKKEFKTF